MAESCITNSLPPHLQYPNLPIQRSQDYNDALDVPMSVEFSRSATDREKEQHKQLLVVSCSPIYLNHVFFLISCLVSLTLCPNAFKDGPLSHVISDGETMLLLVQEPKVKLQI